MVYLTLVMLSICVLHQLLNLYPVNLQLNSMDPDHMASLEARCQLILINSVFKKDKSVFSRIRFNSKRSTLFDI